MTTSEALNKHVVRLRQVLPFNLSVDTYGPVLKQVMPILNTESFPQRLGGGGGWGQPCARTHSNAISYHKRFCSDTLLISRWGRLSRENSYLIFSRKPVSNVYFRTKKECLPENKLGSGGKLGEPQHTLPPLQQGPPSGARTGTPPSDGDHLQGAGALLCRQGAAVRSKGNIPPSHCWQGEHLRKLKLFNNKYILSGNNQLHQYCLVSCNW